jgi:hypothetical protein
MLELESASCAVSRTWGHGCANGGSRSSGFGGGRGYWSLRIVLVEVWREEVGARFENLDKAEKEKERDMVVKEGLM